MASRKPPRPPAARAVYPRKTDGIQLHEVEDGYIATDTADRVHHLNATAALVIELCTGANSTEEIVDLVREAYQLAEPPRQEVLDILTRMAQAGLIAPLV